MDQLNVQLEVPRTLLNVLDVTEEELAPRLKTLIALELFREERISSGKAAELLGISKAAFIDRLDRHGIAYFTEAPGDVAAQVAAVRQKLDRPS